MDSHSSTNKMAPSGQASISWNICFTACSDSPTYDLKMSAGVTMNSGRFMAFAMASANMVLPVPGAPYMSMPSPPSSL